MVAGLSAQTRYKIAIYINATTGNSPLFFKIFRTKKASNAATILLAMNETLGEGNATTEAALITALEDVLQVLASRIYILTDKNTLLNQKKSHKSSVMKNERYVY